MKVKITSEQASLLKESSENQIYFETFSGALNKVFTEIRSKNFDVEYDNTARPKVGETSKMTLPLTYKGEKGGVFVHIQVYNRDNAERTIKRPYELNYYYSFLRTSHLKLKKAQFEKLIEFVDSDISMYDDADIEHYVEETSLPESELMDYYQYYGMNEYRIEELKEEYKQYKKR